MEEVALSNKSKARLPYGNRGSLDMKSAVEG